MQGIVLKGLGWIIGIGLVLPVLSVLFSALTSDFSNTELADHFVSVLLPRYTLTTLYLVFGVTFAAVVFGVGTAWLVNVFDFPLRRAISGALLLPFAVPPYLSAYAYVDFFQPTGPLVTSLVAHGFVDGAAQVWNVRHGAVGVLVLAAGLYPYLYLTTTAALRRESLATLDAARTLGASGFSAFLRVGLPMLRPAIAAGAVFVIFEVLNEFGAVDHFALDTFATGLYRAWYGYGDKVLAGRLAGAFLVFAFLVIASDYFLRGRRRYVAGFKAPSNRKSLTGLPAMLATATCLVPVTLGFLGPCAILIFHALRSDISGYEASLWPLALRSFGLAGITASLAVIIGGTLVWIFRRFSRQKGLQCLPKLLAALGYSIPGSLVAIGVLYLVPINLGFLTMLVYALLTRFSGIAVRNIEAGWEKITPAMEESARTLGATPWSVVRRVTMPLLTPALLGAWLLVFVDTLRELPATIILRPFDFQVLPIYIYNLASDERLEDAARASLLLIGVSFFPVSMIYNRLFKEGRS